MPDNSTPAAEHDGPRQHPRRPHKKTRTGCSDCRRRRVKCTEEKPSCRYCVRRKVDCQYPATTKRKASSAPVIRTRPGSPSSQRDSPGTHKQTPEPTLCLSRDSQSATWSSAQDSPTFSLADIALFHHWITSTSLNFPNQPDSQQIWQAEVPRLAFKHSFIFYAILSVATLHQAYLNQTKDTSHILAATHYHNEGLRTFQAEVSRPSAENVEALFAWSGLNVLYVFAVSRSSYEDAVQSQGDLSYDAWRDRVLGVDWLPLNRGMTSLLGPLQETLRHGRLAGMFPDENYFELTGKDVDLGFGGRELVRIQETWADDGKADTYTTTRDTLLQCYRYARCRQRSMAQGEMSRADSAALAMGLFIPMHMFKEDYITLLRQRQPPALILFGFYGALLHRGRHYWILDGWGQDIVKVVSELLGAYWKPSIAWPLRVIAEDDGP